jgi:protein-S-isoprenylcysteine O-methyltransferase Ste14
MTSRVCDLAILVAVWGTYARIGCVLLGSIRTFLNRRRFVTFKAGAAEMSAIPEPFLLVATTWVLNGSRPVGEVASVPEAAAATAGAMLVLASWGVTIWAFLSLPGLFVGHGVVDGQRVMTGGAYGFVRHPIYLSVALVWLGLAVAFASPGTLLLTVLYVIPSYVLYMRSEEAMMIGAFGDTYRAYQRAVPFLVPRLRVRARSAQPAGA